MDIELSYPSNKSSFWCLQTFVVVLNLLVLITCVQHLVFLCWMIGIEMKDDISSSALSVLSFTFLCFLSFHCYFSGLHSILSFLVWEHWYLDREARLCFSQGFYSYSLPYLFRSAQCLSGDEASLPALDWPLEREGHPYSALSQWAGSTQLWDFPVCWALFWL